MRLKRGFLPPRIEFGGSFAMTLQPVFSEKPIHEFSSLFQGRRLNLDPGFQRKSVWSTGDRVRLIQSIIAGYPVPSVFLYKRDQKGRIVYDVIDGKQRLETLFMFTKLGRFRKDWFAARLDLGDGLNRYEWATIRRHFPHVRADFESYKLPTVEVSGELAQIADLFVRITSAGQPRTSADKRPAPVHTGRCRREADRRWRKCRAFRRGHRSLGPEARDRS